MLDLQVSPEEIMSREVARRSWAANQTKLDFFRRSRSYSGVNSSVTDIVFVTAQAQPQLKQQLRSAQVAGQ